LKRVTYDHAQLLALSGPRNPHPGKLGVIEPEAYADLLLVDGDPVENLKIIMKEGVVYKNTL
jgi:imidazolonepropionase-like amidohydrolase